MPANRRLLCLLCLALATGAAESNEPLALHPQNPNRFLFRGEPIVLLTSGEHYGALVNLDFDFRTYLDELASDGLNHTRVFAGAYRETPESFGITDNPLAPAAGRFVCPWAVAETRPDGRQRFDLTSWNAGYVVRLKALMREASQRGIVVELTLFSPMYNDAIWQACPMHADNNVNGFGDCDRNEVLTLENEELSAVQIEMTRKLAEELRGVDNLYFEVCNEPYTSDVPEAWEQRIASEINRVDPDRLVSRNVASHTKRIDKAPPGVSILTFHYATPPKAVSDNSHLRVAVGANESGFRGSDDAVYRTEAWAFLLAGGAIYNNLDYSFTPAHPDGSFTSYESPGGGGPELREQLGVLKRFLDQFDLVRMRPAGEAVATSDGVSLQALADPGRCYAVYLHTPLGWKPKDLAEFASTRRSARVELDVPPGDYRLRWWDPAAGPLEDPSRLSHPGGVLQLDSPAFGIDVALCVEREGPHASQE